MPVLGIVRPSLEYRRAVLHCRFIIGARHRPEHLEVAQREAADRFVRDMAKQGWEFLGRMALVGGPFPATPIPTSPAPKRPERRPKRHGEPMSTRQDAYPLQKVVREVPTIFTTDSWEYEIAGAFIRQLPATEILATDAPRFEARARRKQHGHG